MDEPVGDTAELVSSITPAWDVSPSACCFAVPVLYFAQSSLVDACWTTLVVKNLPNRFTRSMLLELFHRGLQGLYDFVYVPVDFGTGAAYGYAYVNATSVEAATRLWHELDGMSYRSWACNSSKVCKI